MQTVARAAFTSYLARVYSLQCKEALNTGQPWTTASAARRGREGGDLFVHTNAPATPTGLYRLTVRLP